MEPDVQPRRRLSAIFASGGALAGIGTLLSASCCVLPLLLAQAGLGTVFAAQLTFLAQAKPYLLAGALGLISAALVASFWGGRKPRPLVLGLLLATAVLLIAAEILPRYEGQITRWIGYS